MAELSNALRQKLGTSQNGVHAHPDADVLTAFVEQGLSGAEREQVLAHLFACRECREVVALSLPQLPESATQPVIRPAPVSGWRRWFSPALGLAGLVTAMAAVTFVVMQVPGKSDREKQSLQSQATPAVNQAPTKDEKKAGATEEAFSAERRERAFATNEADKLRAGSVTGHAPRLTVSDRAAGGRRSDQPLLGTVPGKQDFVNTSIFEASAEYKIEGSTNGNLPAAPQPQPSKSETRFVVNAPEIMVFSDIPASQPTTDSKVKMLTPAPPPEHVPWMLGLVQKGARRVKSLAPGASPAISSNGIVFSAMGGQNKFSAELQKQHSAEVAPAPAKPGAEGLDRYAMTLDGLTVSRPGMPGDESLSPEAAAWKVFSGKLLKSTKPAQWEEAYPGASFQFTFVSARGNEVWAGGTHASVLHSRDGGGSWEAPKLGDSASGSIVSILFSGANIQVRTSDDQSWSSSDGGKTWTLTGQN